MDWNDLKYFLAVAHGRTLTAAANQLHVSPSTVSRRIENLEAALQVKLFRPKRDGYDLTASGQDLLSSGERAEANIRVFERAALGKEDAQTGPVRIDVPELLGQVVLLPALTPFLLKHPKITLEMHNNVQPTRLAGEEADIVLRLSRPVRGNYHLRKAGTVSFGFYASRKYLTSFGVPTKPEDLRNHRVVGWTENLRHLMMATWMETICPGIQPVLCLSSFGAQVVAAESGLGIVLMPTFAAKNGDLIRVLGDSTTLVSDLWILINKRTQTLPRTRLVKNAIVSTFADLVVADG